MACKYLNGNIFVLLYPSQVRVQIGGMISTHRYGPLGGRPGKSGDAHAHGGFSLSTGPSKFGGGSAIWTFLVHDFTEIGKSNGYATDFVRVAQILSLRLVFGFYRSPKGTILS